MTQCEDFEAWWKLHNEDEYPHLNTYGISEAWGAWQAALAQKEAQQEPVPDDIVAGALYDFLGYLTTRRTRITMSDRDEAGHPYDVDDSIVTHWCALPKLPTLTNGG